MLPRSIFRQRHIYILNLSVLLFDVRWGNGNTVKYLNPWVNVRSSLGKKVVEAKKV